MLDKLSHLFIIAIHPFLLSHGKYYSILYYVCVYVFEIRLDCEGSNKTIFNGKGMQFK